MTENIKLSGQELLSLLNDESISNPRNPEIYTLSFDHINQISKNAFANDFVTDPETDFGIIRHGLNWGGYSPKEANKISDIRTSMECDLTQEEEEIFNASFPYLNAVGSVLSAVKTIASKNGSEPVNHDGWRNIKRALSKTTNSGVAGQVRSYDFIQSVRKVI
jgi:hypothetical protein